MITTQTLNAIGSTFNNVNAGANQFNTYSISLVDTSAQPTSSSSRQPSQPPFIDAPIHFLSARFTGRNGELAVIERALHRSGRNVPMRCVLYGNQGVGKSQLTYKWAKSTFDGGENRYVSHDRRKALPRFLPAPSLRKSPGSLSSRTERQTRSCTTMVRRS